MPGLRLHDLRHSFATTAVSAGEPLRTVAGLLGHSDLTITEGYTHLADDTLRKAAASVGKHLNDTLTRKGRQPAKPVKAARAAAPPVSQPAIPPQLLREYKRSRLLIPAFCEKHGLDPKLFWKTVKADLALNKKEAGQ